LAKQNVLSSEKWLFTRKETLTLLSSLQIVLLNKGNRVGIPEVGAAVQSRSKRRNAKEVNP
jgi:hypothetical protein